MTLLYINISCCCSARRWWPHSPRSLARPSFWNDCSRRSMHCCSKTQTQAHELHELVLFERMAGGARVGACGARVPRHVRNVRTVRVPSAHRTPAAPPPPRHLRAPTSGWKCRLRVRVRRALTRSRATRKMRETDRATCDSCGAKSCGDAHTWRRGARVAASSARTSATYLFGTVGAKRSTSTICTSAFSRAVCAV